MLNLQDKRSLAGIGLLTPALATLQVFFIYPLGFSLLRSFRDEDKGAWTRANFAHASDFYSTDVLSPS